MVLRNSKQIGDTRVMFHAKHAITKSPGNIIIQGNDIDIFIILLANIQKISESHLCLMQGLNSRNYVDISSLFKELDYVKTVPGKWGTLGDALVKPELR